MLTKGTNIRSNDFHVLPRSANLLNNNVIWGIKKINDTMLLICGRKFATTLKKRPLIISAIQNSLRPAFSLILNAFVQKFKYRFAFEFFTQCKKFIKNSKNCCILIFFVKIFASWRSHPARWKQFPQHVHTHPRWALLDTNVYIGKIFFLLVFTFCVILHIFIIKL